jgi:hypothetical protein
MFAQDPHCVGVNTPFGVAAGADHLDIAASPVAQQGLNPDRHVRAASTE